MAIGKTRCSGSQIDSNPSLSAASAASVQMRGCMRPNVTENFTTTPDARRQRYPTRRTPSSPSPLASANTLSVSVMGERLAARGAIRTARGGRPAARDGAC